MTASAASKGKSAASFGTFHWLAPELATQAPVTCLTDEKPNRGDFQSDVYSLGVVLWEIGTRKLPTQKISNMGLFQAFVEMKSSPPGEIVHPFLKDEEFAGFPTSFVNLVERCLSFDPEMRPAVQDLASGLTTICQEFSSTRIMDSSSQNGDSLRALISERIRNLAEDFEQQLHSMHEKMHPNPQF